MKVITLLVGSVGAASAAQIPLSLPHYVFNASERLIEIAGKKATYLYGPSRLGDTSFYPSGPGGQQLVLKSLIVFGEEDAIISNRTQADVSDVQKALNQSIFTKVDDFTKLYEGQWQRSVPNGVNAGLLTNGSLDLQFSMERLSSSPFSIRRLHPIEALPFPLESAVVTQIAKTDLESLLGMGKLFFVDHSMQLALPKTSRYSGACSAYFYIDDSGDLLPLAIKTNTDFDLIYTPLDEELDWTLAKIMLNTNEALFNEAYHVAAAHAVQEIVHLAATRALSASHPVLAIMDQMMVGSYAPRPMGELFLTAPGGVFDTFMAVSGTGVLQAITTFYDFGAGAWSSNYLSENFRSRGLIDCSWGPALSSFPFFEDVSAIHDSVQKLMTTFVESYYPIDGLVELDNELQDWTNEAQAALIMDFPTSIATRENLIGMLTHFAYLTLVHNTLNGGDPVAVSSFLPYHPASLHAPLPTEKGITDILPWLPNITTAINEIALYAKFNRPVSESSSFLYIFHDPTFIASTNDIVRTAITDFESEMSTLSREIRARTFDSNGMSRGMPSMWNALDPLAMARSSSI